MEHRISPALLASLKVRRDHPSHNHPARTRRLRRADKAKVFPAPFGTNLATMLGNDGHQGVCTNQSCLGDRKTERGRATRVFFVAYRFDGLMVPMERKVCPMRKQNDESRRGRAASIWPAIGALFMLAQVCLGTSRSVAEDTKNENTKNEAQGTIAGKVDSALIRRAAAVVYLKQVEGEFTPTKEKALMDQKRLTFIPHLLPVLKGSTIEFPNNDTVRHNVFSPARSAKQFNLGLYPAGSTKDVTFEEVGVVPLLCNVHSEMSAFVLVLQNPYFTTTDKQGNFKIEGVPPGKYKLSFWHEKLTAQTATVPVVAGKTTTVTFKNVKRARRYKTDLTK